MDRNEVYNRIVSEYGRFDHGLKWSTLYVERAADEIARETGANKRSVVKMLVNYIENELDGQLWTGRDAQADVSLVPVDSAEYIDPETLGKNNESKMRTRTIRLTEKRLRTLIREAIADINNGDEQVDLRQYPLLAELRREVCNISQYDIECFKKYTDTHRDLDSIWSAQWAKDIINDFHDVVLNNDEVWTDVDPEYPIVNGDFIYEMENPEGLPPGSLRFYYTIDARAFPYYDTDFGWCEDEPRKVYSFAIEGIEFEQRDGAGWVWYADGFVDSDFKDPRWIR